MKALALTLLVLSGCAAQTACQPDPISGSPRCADTTGDGVDAVGVGVTAGAYYAAEGCKKNGCEPPFRCETVSQRCERLQCGENADCPPGFECNLAERRCR